MRGKKLGAGVDAEKPSDAEKQKIMLDKHYYAAIMRELNR
jgi:hypothetical protein